MRLDFGNTITLIKKRVLEDRIFFNGYQEIKFKTGFWQYNYFKKKKKRKKKGVFENLIFNGKSRNRSYDIIFAAQL